MTVLVLVVTVLALCSLQNQAFWERKRAKKGPIPTPASNDLRKLFDLALVENRPSPVRERSGVGVFSVLFSFGFRLFPPANHATLTIGGSGGGQTHGVKHQCCEQKRTLFLPLFSAIVPANAIDPRALTRVLCSIHAHLVRL